MKVAKPASKASKASDTSETSESNGEPSKLSISDILAMKKPMTKTVTVQLNGVIAEQIIELTQELRYVERSDELSNKPNEAPKIKAQLEELRADARTTEASFSFQSIGRVEYDALLEQHKPTPSQVKELPKIQFNVDTFPAALVAASCVDPQMEFEVAQAMFDSPNWNGAELQELFMAAFSANNEVPDIPLSNDESGATRNLLSNLLTQANEESPTPSS